MSETIRQSDLRNNNAEIMRRVAAGESFTITVHGQAVADLVPHQREQPKRRFIPVAEIDAIFAATPVDSAQWLRDMADADAMFADDDPLEDPHAREARRRSERP
jgi:prevent-host-death family protein